MNKTKENKTTKVYIVISYDGEYDDYVEYIDYIYSTMEAAETRKKRLLLKNTGDNYCYLYNVRIETHIVYGLEKWLKNTRHIVKDVNYRQLELMDVSGVVILVTLLIKPIVFAYN